MLMDKLNKALEISLDIKVESKEKEDFHERYKVSIDNTSPELQEPIHTMPIKDIEDSRSEI